MGSSAETGNMPDADNAFSLRDAGGGIVVLTWAPGVRITAELAAAAMIQVDKHNGDRERPLLVDMTGIEALSREAHVHFRRRSRISRIAIVGESAVDRVIANFGLRVSPPPVPSRFFNSKAAALAWLQGTGS
jgi:SpoIIAA-like